MRRGPSTRGRPFGGRRRKRKRKKKGKEEEEKETKEKGRRRRRIQEVASSLPARATRSAPACCR
jgi:hypothetical protein